MRHLVPAQGGDPRRLHAARAPAHHRHVELLLGRTEVDEALVAHCRVDGAAHFPPDHQRFLPAAHQAGDALADLLRLPRFGLVGPVGIGHHLPGEAHQVGLALGQDLLAVVRVAQRVAGDHRHLDVLLDLLGRIGVPALGVVHRVHGRPGHLEDARADVQVGHPVLLEQPGRAHGFLQRPAPFDVLLAGVADADGEVLAALVLDGVDDLQDEAHPGEEAAAEAVVALVHVGAHELGDQVAVRPVQLHRVEAGLLHPPGPLGELLDQVVDLLDAHRADRLALGLRSPRTPPRGRPRPGCRPPGPLADIRSLRGQADCRPGCWICTAQRAPCRCMASAS